MAAPIRSTMVKPLGLVTRPSDYSEAFPDGTMSRAENCVARNTDELISAPGTDAIRSLGVSGDVIRKLIPLDNGHVYEVRDNAGSSTITENGNAVALPATFPALNLLGGQYGTISPARLRNRLLLNGTPGYLVGDKMEPASAGDRALRIAGLPQPYVVASAPVGTGTVIPPGIAVAYAVVLRRTFADGYQVASVPSVNMLYYNSAVGSDDPTLTIAWWDGSGMVAIGDAVELYRTDGLLTNSSTADPGTTLKLIKSFALTSTEIAAGTVTLADTQRLLSPFYSTNGEELYTNPGQEGGLGGNRQPPQAQITAAFKGYCFFANTTERAAWTFSIPAGMGSIVTDPTLFSSYWLTNGIGVRAGAGVSTIGSPTITGVSLSNLVGIVVGQASSGAGFAPGTPFSGAFITAINSGAGTITMSQNAIANATTWQTRDVLFLDGDLVLMGNPAQMIAGMMAWACRWEVTSDTSFGIGTLKGATVTIEPITPSLRQTVTVSATNGQNYSPAMPIAIGSPKTFGGLTTPNRFQWSKENQPEHAPAASEDIVGNGTLLAMTPTEDAIVLWCSDGMYRLSGDGGVWRVDVVDQSTILCAPQAQCEMKGIVYAYTNDGVIAVSSTATSKAQRDGLSKLVIGDLLPGPSFQSRGDLIMERGETDDEIYLTPYANLNTLYVLNTRNNIWTTIANTAQFSAISALAWQRSTGAVYGITGPSSVPRLLIASSPAASAPSYAAWGSIFAAPLNMRGALQPLYSQDPMSLKQFISCTLLFDAASSGAVLATGFSKTVEGAATLQAHETSSYATFGPTRRWAVAHAIAPMFDVTVGSGLVMHFQGVSLYYVDLTAQAKQK